MLLLLLLGRFSRVRLCVPHRRQPTRLLCPWDSPGKNTGVGFQFFLQYVHACMLNRFSRVQLCATLWTAAHHAPLFMGFSRQEYWSGLPFPSPSLPHGGLYKPMTYYIGKVPRLNVGFYCSSDGKESACNAGDLGLIPGSGRSPGEGKWQPTPVFLPGKSHGQRSLVGYIHGVSRVGHNLVTRPPPRLDVVYRSSPTDAFLFFLSKCQASSTSSLPK